LVNFFSMTKHILRGRRESRLHVQTPCAALLDLASSR
jgi:hypothetical protein